MNYKNLFKTTLALLCSLLIFSACERDNNKKTETAGEATLVGNCRKSDMSASVLSWTTGDAVTYSAATLLEASDLAEGGTQIVGIRAYIPNDGADFSVFIGTDYTAPTTVKTAAWQPAGWQYVMLDEPIEVGSEDLYIGYTVTSTSIAIDKGSGKNDMVFVDNQWTKLSDFYQSGSAWSLQAVMTGGNYTGETQIDMAIDDATIVDWAKAGDAVNGSVLVRNNGVKTLKNITLVAMVGSESAKVSIAGPLMIGQSALVSLSDLKAPSKGPAEIQIEVVADGDANSKNNTIESTIRRIYSGTTYTRNRILVEQVTGYWCTNCPNGTSTMKRAIAGLSNPDKAAWIAFHASANGYPDPFVTDETNEWLGSISYGSGIPACSINRSAMNVGGETSKFWHPGYAYPAMLEMLINEPAKASLSVNRTYNADTRELALTVSGETTETDLYITAITLLNGTVYKQMYGGQWDESYVHNNVPCTFLTAPTGDKLTVTDGKYSVDLKATVAEKLNDFSVNTDNVTVVVYVHGPISSAAVYNADLLSLQDAAQASIVNQLYEDNNENESTLPYYTVSREYSPVQ